MVSLIGEGVYLARFLAKNDTPPFFSFCISIRDTVGPIRGSVHLLSSLLSSHLVLLSRLSFRLVFVAIFSLHTKDHSDEKLGALVFDCNFIIGGISIR